MGRKSMSGLKEVLPKFGLVFSDRGNLAEIMSKPKLIPIKVCRPHSPPVTPFASVSGTYLV
jgi:hypothetical protein